MERKNGIFQAKTLNNILNNTSLPLQLTQNNVKKKNLLLPQEGIR